MHSFRTSLLLAALMTVGLAILWEIAHAPGTVFAWMVNGVVFGIPALVSVTLFALIAALLIHWVQGKEHFRHHAH